MAEVVERLVGHAAGHRAVADDGDDVAVVVDAGVAGDGQAVGVATGTVEAWLFSMWSCRLSSRLGIAREAARLAELLELRPGAR